jgi:hypothetical protein
MKAWNKGKIIMNYGAGSSILNAKWNTALNIWTVYTILPYSLSAALEMSSVQNPKSNYYIQKSHPLIPILS